MLKTLVLSKKVESEVSIITEGNFYSRQRKANTILFKPGYSLAVKMIPISIMTIKPVYDSMSDLGEIRVYQRADFQSGSRVLKKVF